MPLTNSLNNSAIKGLPPFKGENQVIKDKMEFLEKLKQYFNFETVKRCKVTICKKYTIKETAVMNRLIWLYLDKKTGNKPVYISGSKISEDINISKKTYFNTLDKFKEDGWFISAVTKHNRTFIDIDYEKLIQIAPEIEKPNHNYWVSTDIDMEYNEQIFLAACFNMYHNKRQNVLNDHPGFFSGNTQEICDTIFKGTLTVVRFRHYISKFENLGLIGIDSSYCGQKKKKIVKIGLPEALRDSLKEKIKKTKTIYKEQKKIRSKKNNILPKLEKTLEDLNKRLEKIESLFKIRKRVRFKVINNAPPKKEIEFKTIKKVDEKAVNNPVDSDNSKNKKVNSKANLMENRYTTIDILSLSLQKEKRDLGYNSGSKSCEQVIHTSVNWLSTLLELDEEAIFEFLAKIETRYGDFGKTKSESQLFLKKHDGKMLNAVLILILIKQNRIPDCFIRVLDTMACLEKFIKNYACVEKMIKREKNIESMYSIFWELTTMIDDKREPKPIDVINLYQQEGLNFDTTVLLGQFYDQHKAKGLNNDTASKKQEGNNDEKTNG